MTIWKFTLQPTGRQEVEMPAGAKILSLQTGAGGLRSCATYCITLNP